jgi:hypothetical protein
VCCEDDSLYVPEHLDYQPADDEFAYNINRWNVDASGVYFYRNRRGMCMCVAPRQLLVDTLSTRFEKYPSPLDMGDILRYMGEPGRFEEVMGLPNVKITTFKTEQPTLTFNHSHGIGRRRKIFPWKDLIVKELMSWGDASNLWRDVHG